MGWTWLGPVTEEAAFCTYFDCFLPVIFMNTSSKVVWEIPQSLSKVLSSLRSGSEMFEYEPPSTGPESSSSMRENSFPISCVFYSPTEKTILPPLSSMRRQPGATRDIKSMICYSLPGSHTREIR